jgi:hypothetical protein
LSHRRRARFPHQSAQLRNVVGELVPDNMPMIEGYDAEARTDTIAITHRSSASENPLFMLNFGEFVQLCFPCSILSHNAR